MDESPLSGLLQLCPFFFFFSAVEIRKRLQGVSKLLVGSFSLILPMVNEQQICNNDLKNSRIQLCLIQVLGCDVDLCTPVTVALILCHKLVFIPLITLPPPSPSFYSYPNNSSLIFFPFGNAT